MNYEEISEKVHSGNLSNEYVVVSFLQSEMPSTFRQADWPLHVTIARPFFTPKAVSELLQALKTVASKNKVLRTIGKAKQMFGPNKDVAVVELECTEALQSLHKQVKEVLGPDAMISGPEFKEYRPHVTNQKAAGISVGEEVMIRSISLVAMTTDERKVLGTIELVPMRAAVA